MNLEETIDALKRISKSGKITGNDAKILRKQIVILEALKRAAFGPDALEMIRDDVIPLLLRNGVNIEDFYAEK